MTVYVTGDIHSGLDMQKLRDWELGDSLTSDHYLIVAGDFGFPWGFSAEECADIAWLESRPYTVLFVDGNHERFDHWEERPMEPWHGGLTQRLSDTSPIRRLTRGEVFELDGSTVFTMGGAASNDRQYRKEGRSWWPEEIPSVEEMGHCRASLDRVGWKVDYVVTHEAPADLAGQLCREREREYLDDRLQRFLGELDGRLGWRAWFFGHYHGDEWRDARHRLIYRDIVPVEDAAPASRNLLEAL